MNSPAEKFDATGVGSAADELQPGTRLVGGQYVIESFLNAGGFGITYLARDSLDRKVVVKECFPSSFCRRVGTVVAPVTRERQEDFRSVVRLFVQEAMTLSRLQHDNIVKVHQVFEDNDTAYMAMEYIDGPDLLETIEGAAPALLPAQIQAILTQMLDAIGYVHQEGVLHRDISPDNILLDRRTGRPVLIDFGAARKDVTRKSRALSGLRVVKDGYSPQEFYIGGSLQGPNSDLYALAASFCHLATGTMPRTSQERLSAIASRQGDPQPSVIGRAKGYPVEFLKAIDKGMSIFPRDRFQSVAEWQAALQLDARRAVLSAVPAEVAAPEVAVVTAPVAKPVEPAAVAEPVATKVAGPLHGPAPAHLLTQAPLHNAVHSPVPVMSPIPAPAATLASGAEAVAPSQRGPEPKVALQDPTAAILATLAAAALEVAPSVEVPVKKAAPSSNAAVPAKAAAPAKAVVLAKVATKPALPEASIAKATAQPVVSGAAQGSKPATRRDYLVAGLAAVVLLAGLSLSLGDPVHGIWGPSTASETAVTDGAVAQAGLDNWLVLETVETGYGPRAVVEALNEGAQTDLQVGDVLLVYAGTGEVIDGAKAAHTLLQREMANGVATFGFAVQRDGQMVLGFIALPDPGTADLEVGNQDLENKT